MEQRDVRVQGAGRHPAKSQSTGRQGPKKSKNGKGRSAGRERQQAGKGTGQGRRKQSAYHAESAARRRRERRRKRRQIKLICTCLVLLILGAAGVGMLYYGRSMKSQPSYTLAYEAAVCNQALYSEDFFAKDLCVAMSDVLLDGFDQDASLHAAGLFDVEQKQVLYADRIHDRLYPASTTKLMTAYLTLKYGNLEDMVMVSDTAVANFEPEAVLCGLQAGDQISLYDLLCGLVLYSGNDNAVVIAEHIAGSLEGFVDMMNQEASALGATNTHFMNPHGLHDDNHYTTAYDLYLMFNACIQDQRFLDIIAMKSYTGTLVGQDGSVRTAEWIPSNYYSAGLAEQPPGISVIGGKTGTTNEAGSCVILYDLDSLERPYISIIMGAGDKELLYQDMNRLLTAGLGNRQETME